MAYRMFLNDIDDLDLISFRSNLAKKTPFLKFLKKAEPKLVTSKRFSTSSFVLNNFDGIGNFRQNIHSVLVGGELISDLFWHPILPPRTLKSNQVAELYAKIQNDWSIMQNQNHQLTKDKFWHFELVQIINALKYCYSKQKGILVYTEKPNDRKRAKKPNGLSLL